MSVDLNIAAIRQMHASHMKMKEVKARRQTAEDLRKAKKASKKKEFWENEVNINQYTDERKYAKEYYGETMFETTRYDNDWN